MVLLILVEYGIIVLGINPAGFVHQREGTRVHIILIPCTKRMNTRYVIIKINAWHIYTSLSDYSRVIRRSIVSVRNTCVRIGGIHHCRRTNVQIIKMVGKRKSWPFGQLLWKKTYRFLRLSSPFHLFTSLPVGSPCYELCAVYGQSGEVCVPAYGHLDKSDLDTKKRRNFFQATPIKTNGFQHLLLLPRRTSPA